MAHDFIYKLTKLEFSQTFIKRISTRPYGLWSLYHNRVSDMYYKMILGSWAPPVIGGDNLTAICEQLVLIMLHPDHLIIP
jgi:hypothetical protein